MVKIVGFISFLGLWMLFVSNTATGEILAGLGAALIASVALQVAKRAERLRFRPPVAALMEMWRLPVLILRGTWIVIEELGRRLSGRRTRSLFQLTRFRATGDEGRATAKRALTIIYSTLPPNLLIIGIDTQSHLMLYHQVRKEPAPEIIRRLESA